MEFVFSFCISAMKNIMCPGLHCPSKACLQIVGVDRVIDIAAFIYD